MDDKKAFDIYMDFEEVLTSLQDDFQIVDYISARASINDDMEAVLAGEAPGKNTMYKFYLIARDQYMASRILDNYVKQMTLKMEDLDRIRQDMKELVNG